MLEILLKFWRSSSCHVFKLSIFRDYMHDEHIAKGCLHHAFPLSIHIYQMKRCIHGPCINTTGDCWVGLHLFIYHRLYCHRNTEEFYRTAQISLIPCRPRSRAQIGFFEDLTLENWQGGEDHWIRLATSILLHLPTYPSVQHAGS